MKTSASIRVFLQLTVFLGGENIHVLTDFISCLDKRVAEIGHRSRIVFWYKKCFFLSWLNRRGTNSIQHLFLFGVMKPRDNKVRGRKGRIGRADCAGFTLTEVVFASAILVLLFLVLFQTLLVCQRMGANIKYRLAADAVAFDLAWDIYNRPLSWFQTNTVTISNNWNLDASGMSTVWSRGKAFVLYTVTPAPLTGATSNWVISTSVKWTPPWGGENALPQGYTITRTRNTRYEGTDN